MWTVQESIQKILSKEEANVKEVQVPHNNATPIAFKRRWIQWTIQETM
jgi:hypothetical protein